MSVRTCCGTSVLPGRFCGRCGIPYAQIMVTRAVAAPVYDDGPSLGIDVTDGDLVLNLGDGVGIDLDTGQVEADFGGIDVPMGDLF